MTFEHRYEQPETKTPIKTPVVAQEDCTKTMDTLLNHGVQFRNTGNFIRQKIKGTNYVAKIRDWI